MPSPAELVRAWNEAVVRAPPAPGDFLAAVRRAGVVYGDRPLCRHRRPVFVERRVARRVGRMVADLAPAFAAIRQAMEEEGLDPGGLAGRAGLSPEALALAARSPARGPVATLARLDTVLVDGQPRVLELNAESPAGMAYGDALARLFLDDPLLRELGPAGLRPVFTARRAAAAVLRAWRRAGGSRAPFVAIVDFRDVPTRPEFALFRRVYEALGARCAVADPRDLAFDGRLRLGGETVDVVVRRLLVADILARPEASRALVEADAAGAVLVVNPLRGALLHGKGVLALLHDPAVQARLPARSRRAVAAHVPWTGFLGPEPERDDRPRDVRERALADRRGWVLKPLDGHGGRGVVVGPETDPAAWARAVETARAHVLQRYVPPRREAFPDAEAGYAPRTLAVGLDPYLVEGRLAGFLSRLVPGPLGNVARGGGQVPVFLLPEASS